MDDIKVLLAVFGLLSVLTVDSVHGEAICRKEVICEPFDLAEVKYKSEDHNKPCCLYKGEANCLECVQVQKGNIDMILAAPHGGIYSQLPYLNRTHGCLNGENCEYNHTCYSNPPDPTQCQDNNSCCITDRKDINVGSDLYSNKVLYRIYNRIYEETKMCPSIIVSMPHRRWLEVNRDDSDGEATFGEEVMGKIYAWYHNNLTALVDNLEGRNGILFDLHGQGSNDWTIIGNMVTKGVLNLTDESVLNTKADSSSLKRLSTRTQMSLESLLRGPHSLGTYIADETFDAVPSEQIPRPNDGPFFAAKYSPITKKHRDNIDVFQVEMPKKGRNSSQEQYSEALGNAFLKFYERYYGGCVRYPCGGTNSCSNEGDGFKCSCSNGDQCQATTCTGTAAATGALQVDLSPNKANYDDGECILYMCKDGYAYSEGNLSRVCEDGFWSGKAPVCTACPVYDIAKAEKSPDKDSYDFNDVVTYSCRSGYEPNSMTVTCSDSGWSKDLNLQCIDIDECIGNSPTCKNGGTCQNQPGSFSCHCTSGYSGTYCETDLCDPNPCGDSAGIHGSCSKQTYGYKCDCYHRYIGKNCTELLQHKKCDVKVPSWLLLKYLKDKFCSAIFYWREGSWCCKDINECKKNPCSKKPGKCCINRKKDYACESHKKIGCLAKQVLVTLYDTRTTWVPALAVVGSPAYSLYLLHSPMHFVIEAIARYAITAEVVELLPGSVKTVIATGLEDETTNVTQLVEEAIESANASAQFAIGNIETVSVTCDLGQYIHNDTCVDCPIGKYSDLPFTPSCKPCLPGYFQDNEGQDQCKICPAGSFAADYSSITCIPCPVGHFSPENADTCTPCGPGTVAETEGLSSCSACNPGTARNAVRSRCDDCSAGTFSENGLQCKGCPPGSVALPAQASCTQCEAGTQPSSDFSLCMDCSAGTFSPSGLYCSPCNSGTFSTSGSSSCTPCPGGYFPNSTQSGCSPCLPGSWSSSGDNECTPCEDGSVSGEGQSSCTKCDGGTEPNDQKSECQNCSAGSYSSNGVQCISCASGTYSTPRSSSCTLCPAGYFPNPSQSGCNPCLPGTWSHSGDHECKPCEDGYVSSSGQAKCTKCDGGTEPNVQKSECMNCSAGSYSPNGVRCIPCQSGTYSKPGKSRCTNCSAGFFPNAGQSGCNPCLPGNWSSSGDHECRRCPEGTFSIGGLPSCTECNAGTIPNTGQSQCENCSAGFNSSAGDATCSPCPRDRWSPPGSEFCSECALGEITLKDQSGCIPNIAFNKTAKQKGNGGSSSDEENPDRSGNAVDGDFYNSCSRTKKTHDPWWTVNIEGWFVVRTVVILPTEKFGGAELHDLVVNVKPKGKNIICGTYTGPAAPGERIYVHCAIPIVGERVEIKMLTNRLKEALVLCEVVVIGTPADEPVSSVEDSSEESSKSTKESKESGKKSDSKESGKKSDSKESGEKSDSKESGEKSEKGGKKSGKKSKN